MTGPVKYITANYTLHHIVRQKWAITKKPIIDSRNHKCMCGCGGRRAPHGLPKKLGHKNAAIKIKHKNTRKPPEFSHNPM